MHLHLIPALALLAVLALQTAPEAARSESGSELVQARNQTDLYRQFLFAAEQFMVLANSRGPVLARRVSWDELRRSAATPPGLAGADIPADWHIVIEADGSWLACTNLSERSIMTLTQWAVVRHTPDAVLVDVADPSNARALAARCSP